MANFGETLKREREQRDIPLRDIANATKINLRYLEALEQNRFDILPGGVFNKGFIRAYARFIGADGEALVQRYVEEMTEREARIAGSQPTPGKPGLMRGATPPPRRPDGTPRETSSAAAPSITLREGTSGAAGAPAAEAARTRPDRAPAAATMSFRAADEPFPQARLLLAGTTVIAAFAALGTVFYLVRSARQEPLTSPARQEAPAVTPESTTPDVTDPAPSGTSSPSDEANPATPETTSPAGPAGPDPGSAPPAVKPETRPLPEVPRERDGKTSPVRVASPFPAPVQEPVKQPKSPPPPAPVTAPPPVIAPATAGTGTATVPPPRATGPMSIVVQAATPTTVLLGCDGADRPARTMLAGESLTLRCYSLVRISAEDAGAVRLSLDGVPCPALGSSGSRVEHFTIRAEDARAICPPGGGTGGHGRR